MLAAQQNLKDAGYREKSLLLDDKDEDEEGDRDQEPADNFKSLGPSHPP